MENMPKSSSIAERLGYSPAPQGLASLVWDEAQWPARAGVDLVVTQSAGRFVFYCVTFAQRCNDL